KFEIDEGLDGGCAYDAHQGAITDDTMAKAHPADAVLFGAVGGPKWDKVPYEARPEAGLLRLRKKKEVFANLCPSICYRARHLVVAEAGSCRGPGHTDRARAHRRRLFRRAQADHRPRQRAEARHRHA